MAKNERWIVRVETAERGYLKVSSKHVTFKTENGAWNYIDRMKKRHPECVCFIGKLEGTEVRKPRLALNNPGPDGLDF